MEKKTEMDAGYNETLNALNGAWKDNPEMGKEEFKGTIREHYQGKAEGKSNDYLYGARVAASVFIDQHLPQVQRNEYNQSLGQAVGF